MRAPHCVTVFLLSVCAPVFSSLGAETPSFDAQVLPILQKRCVACHSGAGAQAGLDLSTREGALKGGRSGLAIQPGAAEKSLLVEKIVSRAMPPTEPKLTDGEIAAIRQWIDKGDTGKASQSVTEADVLPIFQMRCVVCHGKRKQEGGLDLRSLASQLKGGKSGAAIVSGKPEESLLIQEDRFRPDAAAEIAGRIFRTAALGLRSGHAAKVDRRRAAPPRQNWQLRRTIDWSARRIASFGRSSQANDPRFPSRSCRVGP